MILLRQYLEDNKLVNESDIASIGQRQSIYGGSFDTNLLELQILKPEEVDAALEEACGLPTLPSALLERRDDRPWDTLPGQLVDRGWVAAIARAGDRLIVATHPELPDAQLGYLYRKIRGFTPVVTAECCIAALNAERTGQTLGGRYAPLIASYRDALQAHRADVGGELLAPTPAPTPAPEPEPDAVTGPSADRRSSVAKLEETLEKLRVPGRPVHKPPPLSITLAKQLGKPRTRLVLARESNKATEALARAAAIIAPRVALLAVKRDGLHALEAPGSSLRLEKDIVIPLEPYSRIERAVLGDVVLTETSSRPLRGALEQRHAIPCIFAPIRVQARPVLVLYLDRNGHDFDPAERAAARDLCDVAEKTFEEVLRLIQRKSGQRSSHRLKTELIHEALHVSAAAPEPPAPVEAPRRHSGPTPSAIIHIGTEPDPAPAPAPAPAPEPEPDAVVARDHEQTPPSDLEETQPVFLMPTDLTRGPVADPTPRLVPRIVRGDTKAHGVAVPKELLEKSAPTVASGELRTEAPIDAQTQAEVDAALADYTSGGGDLTRLRALGDSAYLGISARFPGPLDIEELNLRMLPPPREHGPLIRACIELGPPIVPYLIELSEHHKVLVRFHAVYIFQELRDPRCIAMLTERAFDPDGDIRLIAMRVLETYARAVGYGKAIHKIRRSLTSKSRKRQIRAIKALGIVRDVHAIPTLVDLLDVKDGPLQEAALESLCSITGQQLGFKAARWRAWHQEHGHEHRIVWLMTNLRHRELAVRRWCAQELSRITGVDIEFPAAADRKSRDLAIDRWQEWWRDNQARIVDS